MAQTSGNQMSHGGGHGHHLVPLSTYVKVLLTLLVLTVITVAVAKPVSGFDAGVFNAFIAFAVATVKAVFVMAIFMGLKYDKKLYLVVFLSGVFFLLVMYLFCILDIYTRIHVNNPM